MGTKTHKYEFIFQPHVEEGQTKVVYIYIYICPLLVKHLDKYLLVAQRNYILGLGEPFMNVLILQLDINDVLHFT